MVSRRAPGMLLAAHLDGLSMSSAWAAGGKMRWGRRGWGLRNMHFRAMCSANWLGNDYLATGTAKAAPDHVGTHAAAAGFYRITALDAVDGSFIPVFLPAALSLRWCSKRGSFSRST